LVFFFGEEDSTPKPTKKLSDNINIDALCYSCHIIQYLERKEKKRVKRNKISRNRNKKIRKAS